MRKKARDVAAYLATAALIFFGFSTLTIRMESRSVLYEKPSDDLFEKEASGQVLRDSEPSFDFDCPSSKDNEKFKAVLFMEEASLPWTGTCSGVPNVNWRFKATDTGWEVFASRKEATFDAEKMEAAAREAEGEIKKWKEAKTDLERILAEKAERKAREKERDRE